MSFLWSRRWIQYIAFALVAAIVCLLLANWQDHRRASRDAEIDRIEAHYSAAPVPLETVLPATDATFSDVDEWTRVEATGTYRPEDATVARNRPKAGSAGYWILVPFDVDGGGTLVVARGWAPGSGADATAAEVEQYLATFEPGDEKGEAGAETGEPGTPQPEEAPQSEETPQSEKDGEDREGPAASGGGSAPSPSEG